MQAYNLFHNSCRGCGVTIMTHAVDRQGTLPQVFCGNVCKTNYKGSQERAESKNILMHRRTMSTNEITKRISQVEWANKKYLTFENS